ncbi:MAG: hypothetical protein JW838_14895 [Spirochaetes bacterium]|nr:hypothetical protein [Spirochaetota bacterium]
MNQAHSLFTETEALPSRAMKDYLTKSWLTHDAMWFFNAYKELGIETANRLNLAAIRAMVPLEIKRAKKLYGVGEKHFESFEEFYRFMRAVLHMVLPSSLLDCFTIEMTGPGTFCWEWKKGECFAYKGVSMLGCIDRYKCGVITRIRYWLDELGVEYRLEPEIRGCMMQEKGFCRGTFTCRLR